MNKKRLQIVDKPTTLKTIEEIDDFITKVITTTEGWFDPETLWEIENPYDVMNRLDELGLRVYTYKKKDNKTSLIDLSVPYKIVEVLEEDTYISVCQYNKDNKDDNFMQDLFLSHWLDKQCYFSKLGPHNVCFICNKGRTLKVFPKNYIIKVGINNPIITISNKEDLEDLYRKVC